MSNPNPSAEAAGARDLHSALGRDRILLATLALAALLLAPYVVYLGGGTLSVAYRNGITFAAMASLVAFAAFAGLGRSEPSGVRRLRSVVGAAFTIWTAIELIELWRTGGSQGASSAVGDSFWIAFYALFGFAAFEERRDGERGHEQWLRRLRRAEATLFVAGMFVYFVVVPSRYDTTTVGSSLPSAFLYVALDGFLLGLFARRLLRTESPEERLRWRLLVAAALLFLITDALYFSSLTGGLDLESRPLVDLAWYLPHLAVLFAVRIPARPENEPADTNLHHGEPPRFAAAFLYAALVPATHLLAEALGVASTEAADEQRGSALILTVLLGALATVHQLRIVRVQRELHDEVIRARRRLAATEKLEAIGRLSAGVAHDFNNLLTVVIGRAELVLARADAAPVQRDLETIVRAATRAADLTQQLLAVGQRGMGVVARVDANALVAQCAQELAGMVGDSIRIEIELSPVPLPLELDPSHLERVLRNLASNARDAMPDGGRLRISTALRAIGPRHAVRETQLAAGDYVSVAFDDSGSGMDEATIERLFEPFFTTKAMGQGTGLGLATAYGLVRQYGGEIEVASRPGEGARFEVLLPSVARDGRESGG